MNTIHLGEYLQVKEHALEEGKEFSEWVVESVFEHDKDNIFELGFANFDLGIWLAPYLFELKKKCKNEAFLWVEVRYECKAGKAVVLISIPVLKSADLFCKLVPHASVITCSDGKRILMDEFPVSDDLSSMQVAEKVMAAGKELLNFLK